MTAVPGASLSDAELADAVADRALSRATSSISVASLALAVMALLFLALGGGELDARTLPQLIVLAIGQIGGLVTAAACFRGLRRLRAEVDAGGAGSGPAAAAAAVGWLGRLIVGIPVTGLAAAVVLTGSLRPLPVAVLSCAVGLAIVSQLSVLAAVQRSGLLRAAGRGARPRPRVSGG